MRASTELQKINRRILVVHLFQSTFSLCNSVTLLKGCHQWHREKKKRHSRSYDFEIWNLLERERLCPIEKNIGQ